MTHHHHYLLIIFVSFLSLLSFIILQQPVEVCKEETVQQEDETECQEVENCFSEWIATTCSEEIDIATEFSMETFITTTTTTTTAVTFEEIAAEATGECANEELLAEEIKSQSDEVSIVSSAFAEQLVNVQNQLMALSHLPKTIQSTLDEITKQLQSLIPTPKSLQKSVEPEICKASDGEKAVTNEGDFSLPFPPSHAHSLTYSLAHRCTTAINKIERNLFFTFRSYRNAN